MSNHMILRNNAKVTRINYVPGVRPLMLSTGRLPEQCDIHEIKRFLANLRDSGSLSISSINLGVRELKYYFRDVVGRIDLVVGITNPRIAKYHPGSWINRNSNNY